MKIVRAENAGFCMGVSLALKGLDSELTDQGYVMRKNDVFVGSSNHIKNPPLDGVDRRIVTWGPIIHNKQVTDFYRSKNVESVERLEDIKPGDIVVIRAHGIPVSLEKRFLEMEKTMGIRLADCTCPKVKKAQLSIAEMSADGRRLLLFGDERHPEVRGLLSYANQTPEPLVFNTLDGMKEKVRAENIDSHCFLAAQTTQDGELFAVMSAWLNEYFGHEIPVSKTICNATKMRLREAREIAGHVDLMIVVGSKHSANSRRLAEAPIKMGVPVMFIDAPEELRREDFEGVETVGLTGGSSTPNCLINNTEKLLLSWFGDENRP